MPNNVYIWPLRKQRETLSHSDVLLTLSWRPRAARLSELSISILQNVETKRVRGARGPSAAPLQSAERPGETRHTHPQRTLNR